MEFGSVKSALVRAILHYFRIWDFRSAYGPDVLVANSAFVAKRIEKAYRRDAVVVPPPVDLDAFVLGDVRDDVYLAVSRLVPYKRIDVIVSAFALMPERRLVVIGDGPEMTRIRQLAGTNVSIVGFQPAPALQRAMQRARAFIFAAQEDFGIIPLEAQACGTPVIAYGRGGALETVRGLTDPSPTGVFFDEQTPYAIRDAIAHFDPGARAPL